MPEHNHPLPPHVHDKVAAHEHPYALARHEHPVGEHIHPQRETLPHVHDMVASHDHKDLLGQFRGTIRSLLAVIEGGNLNTEQNKAIHAVRVVIGDAHGTACEHLNTVYETGDRLICQDCKIEITPEAGA